MANMLIIGRGVKNVLQLPVDGEGQGKFAYIVLATPVLGVLFVVNLYF